MNSALRQRDQPGLGIRAAIWLAAVLWTVVVEAQVPAPEARFTESELRGAVESELSRLRSPKRTERTAAEQRLQDLGPAILPWLPGDEDLQPESLREVVARVRTGLEARQAREVTRPSRFGATGRRSIAAWGAEISARTGNRVICEDLPEEIRDQEVSLELDEGDFWPRFDQFVEAARLDWRIDAGQSAIRLLVREPGAEAPPRELAVTWSGPYRVALEQARFRPREAEPPLLRLRLRVVAEPRIRHLLFQFTNSAQTVRSLPEDSGEAAWGLFSPEGRLELPPGGGVAPYQVDFVVPAEARGRRLKLEGAFQATVAPLNLPVRFRHLNTLANSTTPLDIRRRRGGVLVVLDQVRFKTMDPDGGSLAVRVAVAYDKGGKAFESHRAWILHNEAYLESADGQRIPSEGVSEPTFQADGAVGTSYRFSNLPIPWDDDTFVYQVPALIVDLPVKFSIEFAPTDPAPLPE